MAYHGGTFNGKVTRPSLETANLKIELIRKSFSPLLKLFRDEFLKYGGKGTFFSQPLIARGLIDQSNDTDCREAPNENFGALGNVLLGREKDIGCPCFKVNRTN